tara:strand:+ start:3369 stop:3707 length:339 start_codon:yes stop_codon:yes gene_type:complete
MKHLLSVTKFTTIFFVIAVCSTITTGTQQTITVDTPLAAGASCTLNDTQNRIWQVPKTPASLVVKKSDGPKTLICEKEGYHTTTTITGEEFAGARLDNVIHDGGVDILIDAA